jgi:hypothetical protein
MWREHPTTHGSIAVLCGLDAKLLCAFPLLLLLSGQLGGLFTALSADSQDG